MCDQKLSSKDYARRERPAATLKESAELKQAGEQVCRSEDGKDSHEFVTRSGDCIGCSSTLGSLTYITLHVLFDALKGVNENLSATLERVVSSRNTTDADLISSKLRLNSRAMPQPLSYEHPNLSHRLR